METAHTWQPGSRMGADSSRGDRPAPANSTPSGGGTPNVEGGSRPSAAGAGADALLDALPPEMKGLQEQIRRVAPQDTTLLLVGETGTGKTRLARLVHDLSPRR